MSEETFEVVEAPTALDSELVEAAVQCKVPSSYHHILAGFNVQLFGCIAADASSLDEALRDLLENSTEPPSTAQRLLLMSSLRLLFETCRGRSTVGMAAKSSAETDQSTGGQSSSWSEQFLRSSRAKG